MALIHVSEAHGAHSSEEIAMSPRGPYFLSPLERYIRVNIYADDVLCNFQLLLLFIEFSRFLCLFPLSFFCFIVTNFLLIFNQLACLLVNQSMCRYFD